ncbi:hypothetical protein [Roseibium album]|uniref:Abi-alpha family protein n=1 Tax=Roseibium album TaxID=311410 RepID=UPI00249103AD|nr:hypothetical protein [Roseibium album]
MKEDKFKAKASATSVEVSAEGGSAARLGHALADALSPFTGTLGAAGDYVSEFRVKRRLKLLQTITRAKEIQEELGIEAHPVSPKLLTQWMEKASLEDDDDIVLSDLWANLLAKSPHEFSALHAICADLISKLGSQEALVFQQICGGSYLEEPSNIFEAIDMVEADLQQDFDDISKQVYREFYPIPKDNSNFHEYLAERVNKNFKSPGVEIFFIDLHHCHANENSGRSAEYSTIKSDYLSSEHKLMNSLDILKYNNLVNFRLLNLDLPELQFESGFSIELFAASVTSLGAKFAINCVYSRSHGSSSS